MERGGEPTPGAVQADAGGVAGTAEDDGDLAGVEAFPAGQREDLAVGVAEAAERGRHPFQARRRVAMVGSVASSDRSRSPSAVRRCSPRRWLASTFLATPYSHGRAASPAGTSPIRRQTVRKVSAMTSAASSALPGPAQRVAEDGGVVFGVHPLEPPSQVVGHPLTPTAGRIAMNDKKALDSSRCWAGASPQHMSGTPPAVSSSPETGSRTRRPGVVPGQRLLSGTVPRRLFARCGRSERLPAAGIRRCLESDSHAPPILASICMFSSAASSIGRAADS